MSSTASATVPARQSRTHSHSVSLGSFNPTHRVTRRKSVASNSQSHAAAIRAALKEGGEDAFTTPLPKQSSVKGSRVANGFQSSMGAPDLEGYPSPPASLPNHASQFSFPKKNTYATNNESAIDDRTSTLKVKDIGAANKARARRASEGTPLGPGKERGAPGDLKCDKCGKGYKHSSCLTKHLFVSPALRARYARKSRFPHVVDIDLPCPRIA
jgi:hypothetical protein